jgi:hypothetical protein
MFLIIDGEKEPDCVCGNLYTANKAQQIKHSTRQCPKGIVPLSEAPWPESVKATLVQLYTKYGFTAPLKQKLVDPYASAFGGGYERVAYAFDNVNWDMVVDYFTWEITCKAEPELISDLQEAAFQKYGFIFSHRGAYFPNDY